MATILRCDVCGKINDSDEESDWNTNHSYFQLPFLMVDDVERFHTYDLNLYHNIDMCPDCKKKFIERYNNIVLKALADIIMIHDVKYAFGTNVNDSSIVLAPTDYIDIDDKSVKDVVIENLSSRNNPDGTLIQFYNNLIPTIIEE